MAVALSDSVKKSATGKRSVPKSPQTPSSGFQRLTVFQETILTESFAELVMTPVSTDLGLEKRKSLAFT